MSSTKVRGITIELGADTTGLSKAFKDINSQIGSTTKQLKDVNKLLKLDPGNTELLEQKQRLLKDSIGNTKEKLEDLKKAQEEVGKTLKETGEGQEQYDALQREIVSCEQELKNLQAEANRSNEALAKVAAAGDKIKAAGDKISSAGQALMPLSAAAAGVTAGIVKTTADFDSAMSKVAAVSGAAGDEFDALRDKAREMGATTKFTATESAEAMNYMAMAGWKTDQMLEGISGVMNLAAASGEDLATTSDIVTDALTAFGMKAEDSGRFADILASAASNANTNVSMMGESFKYAAPVAGSLGYSAEDVAIALGLMANSGIKASMAGTSLRNIFQRMAKPTKESQAAMDRLGLSLQNSEGEMYSFREIMDQLRASMQHINMPMDEFRENVTNLDKALDDGDITEKEYTKDLEELMKQAYGAEGAEKARAAAMLGGTRAMSGLLAIANATEEDYNKLTSAIDNSSQAFARTKDGIVPLNEALASGAEILETYEGSAASMAATMQDNAAGQAEILKSQIQELAISLGDLLMPKIRELISFTQNLMDTLNGMDDGTKQAIMNTILVAAALGPVLIVVGKVTSAVGTLMKVIGAMSAPVLAIIAVLALLAAMLVTLWQTNDEFRVNMTNTWNQLLASFNTFGNGITQRLNEMGFSFQNFGEVVMAAWTYLCNNLAPIFENTFKAIQVILDGALTFLTGIFDVFAGLFTGNWEQMWNGVKEIFSGIWKAIKGIFVGGLNNMIGGINAMITGLNKVKVGDFDVNIPTIPTIALANGGILSRGTALVGEAGPELLTMANGRAIVQPLTNNTNNYGGATNNFYIQSNDPYAVAEQVSSILDQQTRQLRSAWA